jgi:hypothetical protein
MITTKEQFVIDESGKRTAVLLEITQYEKLLEAQEELEELRAFDEAKASDDQAIPFSQLIEIAQKVEPIEIEENDFDEVDLMRLAESGGEFDFLNDDEDIYSVEDLKVRYR